MLKTIIIMSLLTIYCSQPSAEIYKWLDQQGKVHYGDKPLPNSTEMEIDSSKKSNVKMSQSRKDKQQRLLNAYDEDNKLKAQEKEKSRKKKKKLAKHCSHSKKRLRRYERARYLYTSDKDGNRIVISNEEREKVTSGLKKNIQKNCK